MSVLFIVTEDGDKMLESYVTPLLMSYVNKYALPLGWGCCAQQVGSEAGCPGAGMLSGTIHITFFDKTR